MKNNYLPLIMATALLLVSNGVAYCDNLLAYEETVTLIKETMLSSTSDLRKESYGSIKFDKCSLNYSVSGTYPIGELYDINFSNIDFSSLRQRESKTGHDYTAFIILNFNNYFRSKSDFKNTTNRTMVINVSTDEKAQLLFKAFLHLGELCATQKSPLQP